MLHLNSLLVVVVTKDLPILRTCTLVLSVLQIIHHFDDTALACWMSIYSIEAKSNHSHDVTQLIWHTERWMKERTRDGHKTGRQGR